MLALAARRRPQPTQRYMTVEDEDDEMVLLHEPRFSVGDEERDEDEPGHGSEEGEEEGEPDFDQAELDKTPVSTADARVLAALPSGAHEGDLIFDEYSGVSRESWMAEMNAELAEFDALTSLPESILSPEPTRGSARWDASFDDELGQRLATPKTPKTP